MRPNDPLYRDQWHFDFLGDIETIWDEYTGEGVRVGIYSNGVDYNHPDLIGNYDAQGHIRDNSNRLVDPYPNGDEADGTATAGLIGAEGNNNEGGIGVAFESTLSGVNLFNPTGFGFIEGTRGPFLSALRQAADNFDVMVHNWMVDLEGASNFIEDNNLNFAGPVAATVDAYETISDDGRDGLGTVIVQAMGEDDNDGNGSGLNATRYTISVAAVDEDGFVTSDSNWGTSVLVSGPTGGTTTDIRGNPGFDPTSYTEDFGDINGTGAAAGVVSGVAALMLEANPELGWRDVQNILAASADHTGSDLDGPAENDEVSPWMFNGATTWNGGGMHVSESYGYGVVNAYNAVRMAEIWHLFDEAQTSDNEEMVTSNRLTPNVLLPDGDPTGETFTLTVRDDLQIEHVALNFGFTTTFVSDLRVFVTSPDGTTLRVMDPVGGNDLDTVWTLGIDLLRGESAEGDWQIRIADTLGGDQNVVTSLELEIYGTEPGVDDVHHFTDEIFGLVLLDPDRGFIRDTNGGTDWLNLAAMAGVITGGLDVGDEISVDGRRVLEVDTGTILENAVLSDGDDVFSGNRADNYILGMRGDDSLEGEIGDDTLDGGVGNDTLAGGNGDDDLIGGLGDDSFIGNNGRDYIYGGIGNDTANGGFGRDEAYMGDGDDTYLDVGQGRAFGRDTVYGEDGNDTLNAGGGDDTLYGGIGDDTVNGGRGNDSAYGDDGNDNVIGFGGNDYLYGGIGDDTVNGGGGNDVIEGGTGNDTILGIFGADNIEAGDGNDSVNGGLGRDTVALGAGDDTYEDTEQGRFLGRDTVQGGAGNDTISTGGGNDLLSGELDDDTLDGGAGNDIVQGQRGDDRVIGGAGNDRVVGGIGEDTFVFGVGSDIDRVADFQRRFDTLELNDALWADMGTLTEREVVREYASSGAAGVVFDFGDGDLLILEGVGAPFRLWDNIDIV